MGPTYARMAAGACLIATGLLSASGAIALAAPDSGTDNDSNQSQTANANRKPGHANVGKSSFGSAGKSGAASRPAAVSTPNSASATAGSNPTVGSTKGPGANAVANPPGAAGDAISSISSAVRGAVQAMAPSDTSLPSLPTSTGVPTTGPLAGALAPLSNLVGNVAGAIIGPQAAQPLVDAANQFLNQVTTLKSNTSFSSGTNSNKPVRNPAVLPTQQTPDLQTVALPTPIVPGSSRFGVEVASARGTTAPAPVAPGVITPAMLSSQVAVSAAQSAPAAPTASPAAPNWLSGVASQIFHGVREAVRNVTLTELALAALPGVAGLLFFFGTGVGLGRRQAKFGFAMASSGAVRFAVRGPLGVVRNGSSVSVHSRKNFSAKVGAMATAVDGTDRGRRHLRMVDRAA